MISPPPLKKNLISHPTPFYFLVLLLATFVAYAPALQGDFLWDDNANVVESQALRTWQGLQDIWTKPGAVWHYYPLYYSTLWLQFQLWELQPLGYHVVSVALHAFCAFLLGVFLRRLRMPGAYLAGWIFALHPLQVDSVAWITELKNILSCLFFLAALYVYFFPPGAQKETERRDLLSPRLGWLAFLLYVCALLSKTIACCWPVAALLVLWWRNGRIARLDVLRLIPAFAVGLGFGLFTAWVEQHYGGAQGPEWQASLLERCLVAGRSFWFYLGKFLWPEPLIFIYPRWSINAGDWTQYAFPLAALALIFAAWKVRGIDRGPLTAVLYYGAALFPAMGFFPVYFMRFSYVADHFQYLAGLSLAALAAATTTRVAASRPKLENVLYCSLVGLLGMLTFFHAFHYRNERNLWLDTVSKNPESWLAQNNLANELQAIGETEKAVSHFREALRLKPDYVEAHYNVALALESQGKLEPAAAHLLEALRLQPVLPSAMVNLGGIYLKQGKNKEGKALLEKAIEIKPQLVQAYVNLGSAYLSEGRTEEAARQFEKALGQNPDDAHAHHGLASAMRRLRRTDLAIQHWRSALKSKPDMEESRLQLAIALFQSGQKGEALQQFDVLVQQKPENAALRYNYARALAMAGRREEALEQLEKALALKPDFPEASGMLNKLRQK